MTNAERRRAEIRAVLADMDACAAALNAFQEASRVKSWRDRLAACLGVDASAGESPRRRRRVQRFRRVVCSVCGRTFATNGGCVKRCPACREVWQREYTRICGVLRGSESDCDRAMVATDAAREVVRRETESERNGRR